LKLSYRWLARHVDLSGVSAQQIASDLTLSTAEVEGVERFAPQLDLVAVGYVLARERHPDAEKLSLCRVDAGEGEPLAIVCGAPNVAAGQKVAVAKIGTTLPGGLKIKKSKIRGVESCGMICSERELELSDEHQGIWGLPEDAAVGKSVAQALGLEDWVLEIDNKSITHRPDLWGHRGIATEIAAIQQRPLKPLAGTPVGGKPLASGLPSAGPRAAAGEPFPVRIASAACSRYLAVPIELPVAPAGAGGRARKSPEWLRMLLLAVGQRPIDLLVDLSNFVMLDLGQPNHLFDRKRLSPEGILVRDARAGERMTTLDGVERALEPADLLICSGDEPVALAGIMGGEGSKVSADTTSLVLEVATFHPTTVRRTSARLSLRTDSSARFEKSLDPLLAPQAAGHFVRLLQELEPQARVSAPPTDVGDWKDPSRTIALRGARVRTLLGAELADEAIAGLLTRLGFGVERGPSAMAVRVPSARATKDVTIEQDLVEEVGRLYRYENIPERTIVAELAPPPRDERRRLVRRIEDRLSGSARFRQTIGYSFVEDELLSKLGLLDAPHVQVVNPVAEGSSRVRRSVAPSLLGLLAAARRQRAEVRLFEIGKGYLPERPARTPHGEQPGEVHELALAWALPPPVLGARFDAGALPRLRGVLDDLLAYLGLEAPAWGAGAREGLPSWAHAARALCATYAGESEPAIVLAALEPALARALGLSGELASAVAVASVSLDPLLAAPARASPYRSIPRFPPIKVDVALAVPVATTAGEVRAAIERAGKGLVEGAELFDLYSGESLGPGRKSLAWHVLLSSPERTLSDEDAHKFLARVEREASLLGGELRRE